MEANRFAATENELVENDPREGDGEVWRLHAASEERTHVEVALNIMVDATMLSMADVMKSTALVQQQSGDKDGETGAPATAATMVPPCRSFREAEAQLAETRNTETNNIQNVQMLHQPLEVEVEYGEKELSETKGNMAAAEEKKAGGEGELDVTTKNLQNNVKDLAVLHTVCIAKARDYEDETNHHRTQGLV